MVNENELWIHQESAVISAEFHDVWRFTPEFLLEEEIVSNSWACHQGDPVIGPNQDPIRTFALVNDSKRTVDNGVSR